MGGVLKTLIVLSLFAVPVLSGSVGRMPAIKLTYFNIEGVAEVLAEPQQSREFDFSAFEGAGCVARIDLRQHRRACEFF